MGGSECGLVLGRLAGRWRLSALPSPQRLTLTPCRVSEGLYKEMTTISREKNIPITMHCAEAPADRTFFASHSHTPMSYCESVNLLSPQTVLVHMVHLDDSDIAKLAETGARLGHLQSPGAAGGGCECDPWH